MSKSTRHPDDEWAVIKPFVKGAKVIVRAPHPDRSHPRAATILEPPRIPGWANPAVVRYHDGEHPGEEEIHASCLTPSSDRVDIEVAYLHEVAETAERAFWQAVAEAFPAVTGGDFPPDATHEFSTACERAIETWLMYNADGSALTAPEAVE